MMTRFNSAGNERVKYYPLLSYFAKVPKRMTGIFRMSFDLTFATGRTRYYVAVLSTNGPEKDISTRARVRFEFGKVFRISNIRLKKIVEFRM